MNYHIYRKLYNRKEEDVDKILSSIPSDATVYIPVNGIDTGRAWAPKYSAYLCSLGLVYDMIMLEYNQIANKIGISKFDPENKDEVYYSTYFEISIKDAYDVFGDEKMKWLLQDPAPMTITFKRGE